jgi:hypothetical protein
MQVKHTVNKFNPYEPSIRERLAQRDAALRTHAYAATGKRKYAVSKPLDYSAKKELNVMYGSGGSYSIYYHQSIGRALRPSTSKSYIIIDYESWEVANKIEERWLTEKQATMLRLQGFDVDDIL